MVGRRGRCSTPDAQGDEGTPPDACGVDGRGARPRRTEHRLRPSAQHSACTRGSSVSSGWKVAARRLPSRTSTGRPSTRASTSTDRARRAELRRADEDAAQAREAGRRVRVHLRRERVHLRAVGVAHRHHVEQAERAAPASARPRCASRIAPAQVPKHRPAAARRSARSGSQSFWRSMPFAMVVLSPPGQDQARRGPRGPPRAAPGTASAPSARQRPRVRLDVALDGEDPDTGRLRGHARASRAPRASAATSSASRLALPRAGPRPRRRDRPAVLFCESFALAGEPLDRQLEGHDAARACAPPGPAAARRSRRAPSWVSVRRASSCAHRRGILERRAARPPRARRRSSRSARPRVSYQRGDT